LFVGRLIIITTLTILLDQVTKHLVLKEMRVGQSMPVLDGFFNLTFVMNPGAAFGILSTMSEGFRVPFFLGVSLIAIAVVLLFYFQRARDNGLLQVGLTLVLGGAVGNMIDRVRFGEVVDFIDIYYRQFHWPAFNIADSAISIGVGLLILDAVLTARREGAGER
jgi:signal peptidase II